MNTNEPFPVGSIIKVARWGTKLAVVCRVKGYERDILGPLMLLEGHPYMASLGLSHVQYDCKESPNHEPGTDVEW